MAWTIELTPEARADLKKLDAREARRILKFLHRRLQGLDNPRALGKALQGSALSGLWRYRVGDYRILCCIQDAELIVLVVAAEHRREVYR